MNEAAFNQTIQTNIVTFFSRSKNRLWTKGEESGHFLNVVNIKLDCDQDTFLIMVKPNGPTCHTNTDTCWQTTNNQLYGFISELEKTIEERKNNPNEKSYVSSLFANGLNKIAQKVGEEAVEVIIEAKDNNDKLFLDESADLLFHYLILLQAKEFKIDDVIKVLINRNE